MNPWIKRSIELASKDGYLDALQKVYSVADVGPRKLPPELVEEIVAAHNKGDPFRLVSALLKLSKFPIDDIYVGYLRLDKDASNVNPETVKRIAKRLFDTPVEDVIKLCKQPMVGNRQMGELFHRWFVGLGFPQLDANVLRNQDTFTGWDGKTHNILTLKGTRKDFRDFANDVCGCGLEKELDVFLKVKGEYIIGEAKFFSGFGGHQNDQFQDAVDNFLLKTQGTAHRIAILDGVLWLDTKEKMSVKVRNLESIAMSALLLPRFLEDAVQITVS